ncbi:MAG: serine protease, partial [Bdellovibrionota bacterium]
MMRSKSLCFLSILLFTFCAQSAFAVNLGAMRKSLFKIHVISQTPNYEQPWAQNPTQSSSGTGFYIGKEGIMTNAHVVADGKFITVQRDGDDRPMTARVRFIAHDCDLALLEVQDPAIFKGLTPMTFADFPEVRESVNTIGYPTGGEQLSITQGVVSRVSYRRYVHTGSDSHLLVQVDS